MLNGRSRSNHGEKVMYSIWDTSSFWAIEVDIFVFEAELIPSTIKQRTENATTKVSLGSARQFIPDKDSPDERSYLRTVDDLRGPCFAWWWSLSCKVGLQFVEFRRTMKTKSGLFTDGWTQKAATKFSQFFHTSRSVLVRWLSCESHSEVLESKIWHQQHNDQRREKRVIRCYQVKSVCLLFPRYFVCAQKTHALPWVLVGT